MPLGRRPDGDLVRDVPPYRRMTSVLFPRRNDSTVYFALDVDLTDTLPAIDRFNARPERAGRGRLTLFTLLLHGVARVLADHPRLNRFVAGRRLYQRRGIHLSYTAKKSFAEGAPLVVIKRLFAPGETLDALVADLDAKVKTARGDEPSYADKELSLLLKLPLPFLALFVRLARRLDAWGLLPRSFIDNDPFFASAFLTNLGSVGLDAAYHHLYEYGTIPIFCVLGRVHDAVLPWHGAPAVRKVGTLKIAYDERIEDGFNAGRALVRLRRDLEDPAALL
jgi:hypothetical protein